MNRAHAKIVVKQSRSIEDFISILATAFSVLLILVGAVGMLVLRKPLEESQDLRGQASVDNGQVEITHSASLPTQLNQAGSITLLANTHGVQTDGVQLFFKVKTETFDQMNATIQSSTGLQTIYQEVEAVSDGFLIGFVAVPSLGKTYSTTAAQPLLTISFTPYKTGDIKLEFDNSRSYSTIHGSNPAKDTLRTIQNVTFTVTTQTSSTSTPLSCDQACTSNTNCQANLACISGKCRLASNPSSTSCVNPPDGGLNRKCNEYCADTRECGSGFTCFYNRCRRPDNPDSTSCVAKTPSTTQVTAVGCNLGCTANRDCAVNLRCFEGACRFATNPASLTCSAATQQTVSTSYTQPSSTKGGLPTASPTASPVSSPKATPSTATKSATATPSGTTKPFPIGGTATGAATTKPTIVFPSPTPSPVPTQAPVATNNPVSTFIAGLRERGAGFPLAMILSGVAMIGLVILLFIVKKVRSSGKNTTSAPVSPAKEAKIDALEQKIASMQTQTTVVEPQPVRAPEPVPVTTPKPVVSAPAATPIVEPAPVVAEAKPVPAEPTAAPMPSTQAPTPATSSGSMLERMKQKGLQTPQ